MFFNNSVLTDPGSSSASPQDAYPATTFSPSNSGAFTYDPNPQPCFAAGTHIATPDGHALVEDIAIGDHVLTHSGKAKPVIWVGYRTVNCATHPRADKVRPMRILAHAFGDNLPVRDLYVSPDHCLFIEGVLIPAKQLENGSTVTQIPFGTITYYHIELDQHDVLLAEGLPVESYLDTQNRHAFANGGGAIQLHPDFAPRDAAQPEPARPRSARRQRAA